MTDITVDTGRIKLIRKARKIGRPKLAKQIGMTERQLTKLETSKSAALAGATAHMLSDALQVPLPTLTGEFDVTEADLKPHTAQSCTTGCCG